MLSKIIWAVLSSSISSSVVGQKPQFERSNQTYQRSESRRDVELTCVVYNVTATMELSWQRNNKLITRGSEVVTEDDWFGILTDKAPNTYMLTIDSVMPWDSGIYECVVTMTRGLVRYHVSKIFRLEVIEPLPQPGWRGDGRCGENNFLPPPLNHVEAGCDGLGSNPCCGMDGWCRNSTDDHCNCPSCVDYSAIEDSPCGPGFQLVQGNYTWEADYARYARTNAWETERMCVHVGKTPMDYERARLICQYLSATLMSKPTWPEFPSVQELKALAAGSMETMYWLAPPSTESVEPVSLSEAVARRLQTGSRTRNVTHQCSAIDRIPFIHNRRAWYYRNHQKNCQDVAAYPLCVKHLL